MSFPSRAFLHPFRVLQIFLDEDVARCGALFSGLDEGVHRFCELGALLAEGPRDLSARRDSGLGVRFQGGEHIEPEIDHETVGYGGGNEPGGDHLEEIPVLEELVRVHDLNGRLALRGEALVQCLEVLRVAARGPNVDFLPRELVHGRDVDSRGAGNDNLRDVASEGVREVDLLLPLGCDGERRRGDVALTREETRDQLIPPDRHDDDVDLDVSGAELLVQLRLEGFRAFVRDPELPAFVDKILHRALDGEHANDAPLDHPVEVPLPGSDEGGEPRRIGLRLRRGLDLFRLSLRLGHLGGRRGLVDGSGRLGRAAGDTEEAGR